MKYIKKEDRLLSTVAESGVGFLGLSGGVGLLDSVSHVALDGGRCPTITCSAITRYDPALTGRSVMWVRTRV
jgi:hypothetical protein